MQEQANLACQGAISDIIKQAERAALIRMKVTPKPNFGLQHRYCSALQTGIGLKTLEMILLTWRGNKQLTVIRTMLGESPITVHIIVLTILFSHREEEALEDAKMDAR